MEPREGWTRLRFAFNAGPIIRHGKVHKFVRRVVLGALCVESNPTQVWNSCSEVVEHQREAGFIPVPIRLCFHSVESCWIAFWECRPVERSSSSCCEQHEEGEDTMVRERMPCRRGPGRGEPSRPPAADIHHHCCCCYCYRRMGANPIPARQVMEVGGSADGEPMLPAFGSVIFTLGSSRENAGINAHISVLFTKIPEEHEEESSLVMAEDNSGRGKGKLPMGESSRAADSAESGKGKAPIGESSMAVGTSRSNQPRPLSQFRDQEQPSPSQNPMAMWEGVAEGEGWRTIEEEEPEI